MTTSTDSNRNAVAMPATKCLNWQPNVYRKLCKTAGHSILKIAQAHIWMPVEDNPRKLPSPGKGLLSFILLLLNPFRDTMSCYL